MNTLSQKKVNSQKKSSLPIIPVLREAIPSLSQQKIVSNQQLAILKEKLLVSNSPSLDSQNPNSHNQTHQRTNNYASQDTILFPITAIQFKALLNALKKPTNMIRPTTSYSCSMKQSKQPYPKINFTKSLVTIDQINKPKNKQIKFSPSSILSRVETKNILSNITQISKRKVERNPTNSQQKILKKILNQNCYKNFLIHEQMGLLRKKLLPSLFEVLEFDITLKIANFFTIEELINLATVSRQARNLVAVALNRINYSIKETLKYEGNNQDVIEKIKEIQQNFHSIISNQNFEKDFLIFLGKDPQDKYCILEILKAGMKYCNNNDRQHIDIISNIKRKGILNCFSGINLPYIPQSHQRIEVPSISFQKNTLVEQFIQVIYKYVELRNTNRVSIQKQKQLELDYSKIKFMNNKDKLLATYVKPLQRLKKSSFILDYINKNTLFIIIKFLTFKEVFTIYHCGKTMREVLKQVIQSQLISLQSKREDKLASLGFHNEFGNGILYVKQFEQFAEEESYIISSQRFYFPPLCKLLKAISLAVTSLTLEDINSQFSDNYWTHYKINLSFSIPDPERLKLINPFLKKYPTLREYKQKLQNYKNISEMDERGCIFLYQTMKGIQKLSLFNQNNLINFKREYKTYFKKIYSLDSIILKYQRLIGENYDELFMLPQFLISKNNYFLEEFNPLLFPK